MNETLTGQALETIKHYDMLSPGDEILIGLSGGADSVALLQRLCSLRDEYKLDLCAAHLNHGLRGRESDGDEAFCRELCERLAVPLHVKHVDLSSLASGIEEAGRSARYAFFAEFHRKIALAHTLSDRMETFLMNAGRGSALRGLCSIPPVRQLTVDSGQYQFSDEKAKQSAALLSQREPMCQCTVIRPLIECSRAQIEEYCAANTLTYRTDSTNFDTGYRRNMIRHEVLPLLGWEAGPLRRLFRSLEADEGYLSMAAARYEGDIPAAPEALKGRLLRKTLEAQGREPSRARMRELEKQMAVGAAFLPPAPGDSGGKNATPTEKILHIEPLPENFIKNLREIPKEGLANCLDCDTIIGDIIAGRRIAGDRMRMCNGAGTKSFKKLCQERGIQPGAREDLLVARDDLGPVWVEGFGCAHRCAVTGETRRAIRVSAM
ncbi:MAG: tRNA lysidine(34) synthetase TilS [Oscillospiraceae bacterium]|nr:tRNA lysidine(34) synthetase TilS [Oscillospiraceae bacterium]